ncbi:MAG: DM13 domain-containing protein [Dehalococcoidia bacterium]
MSFFGDLEEFAADLYPYRWLITMGLIVAGTAALAVGYRLGLHRLLVRHRLAATIIGAAVLALALPAGWYTLSPLWERSRVDEASPLAAAPLDHTPTRSATAPAATPPPAAFAPRVTHRGTFSGADDFHFGRGEALLIETMPGSFTLRFEDFSVRNGPDLFVYLTDHPDSIDGAINLGDLKATDGNFNYDVPAGADITQYRYAIVWCRQFAVQFASAPINPT